VPSALVEVERTCAVPTLVAVTVTLGTTAQEESLTVPVSAPVAAVWLKSDGTTITEQITSTKQLTIKI
jgi:hypothetical protein